MSSTGCTAPIRDTDAELEEAGAGALDAGGTGWVSVGVDGGRFRAWSRFFLCVSVCGGGVERVRVWRERDGQGIWGNVCMGMGKRRMVVGLAAVGVAMARAAKRVDQAIVHNNTGQCGKCHVLRLFSWSMRWIIWFCYMLGLQSMLVNSESCGQSGISTWTYAALHCELYSVNRIPSSQ
jgi:hypothetical protein